MWDALPFYFLVAVWKWVNYLTELDSGTETLSLYLFILTGVTKSGIQMWSISPRLLFNMFCCLIFDNLVYASVPT